MCLAKFISCVFIFIALVDILGVCAEGKDLEIYSLHIKSDIKLRYATTLITSRVVNKSPTTSHEAAFDVTLPKQAMISNFTMEIDGKIYPGQVKEKAAAQKQYDKAKKKGQSAGQVKARPRETNKFQVTVNVAAQGKVSFNLTYQELLERRKGLYQHVIYINPGQTVNDLKVDVAIAESRDINRLIVPPVTDELLTNTLSTDKKNIEAQITRPTSKSAYIQYHPTIEKQREMGKDVGKDVGISGLFRVFYDVERGAQGGEVLAVNGYFVHFFAPEGLEPVSKNVLFILDVSGSMQGTKIRQLKQAMRSILKDLHEGDNFSIMRFSSEVQAWGRGFLPVNKVNINAGLEYIAQTKASGWTNINHALLVGIKNLKDLDGSAAGIIVFLTDGEPTKGETNPDIILANVRKANEAAQMYSLAFGDGADYDFVKKVSAQNYGVGRKIYEDSDADLQIAGFYDDISSALLQDVKFKYVGDGVENGTITVTKLKTFFDGSEFIVAGKLKDISVDSLSTHIIGNSSEGELQLSIDSAVTDIKAIKVDESVSGLTKLEDLAKITEKIWAYLTIKQLLKRELQDITDDERKALREQILQKSLEYNFVTPLTSMVVTKPEKSDLSELEGEDKLEGAQGDPPPTAKRPSQSRWRGGGGGGRGGGGGDPHFEIWLKGLPEPIRFNVRSKPGEAYRLVEDRKNGLKVNAGIIKGKKIDKFGEPKTYIGEIYIQLKKRRILIAPHGIIINGKTYNWDDEMPYHSGKTVLTVSNDGLVLTAHLTDGVELEIKRFVHITDHVDYLNFIVNKQKGLSQRADGLIGQFVHKTVRMRKKVRTADKVRGHIVLTSNHKRYRMIADLVSRKNVMSQTFEAFWMVHQPGEKLLDADINTYKIKDLYS